MDNCGHFLELISARLDGELDAAGQAELAEHLASCPPCRALLAELEGIHAAMGGLGEAAPPPELKSGVLERIRAGTAPIPFPAPEKRKSYRQWRSLGAMAAVFAVVVLGAVGLRMDSPPPDAAGGGPLTALTSAPAESPHADGGDRVVPFSIPAADDGQTAPAAPKATPALPPDAKGAPAGGGESVPEAAAAPNDGVEPTPVPTADPNGGRASLSAKSVRPPSVNGAAATAPTGQGDAQDTEVPQAITSSAVLPTPAPEKEPGTALVPPANDLLTAPVSGDDPDLLQPPPQGTVHYDRLPQGWEDLFPDVSSIDGLCVSGEEARAFLALLEEQGIPCTVEGDLSGDGDCQLLLVEPE